MPRRLSILLGVSPTKPHTRTGTQSDSLPTAAQPARQYAHQALREQLVRNNTTGVRGGRVLPISYTGVLNLPRLTSQL